MTTSSALIIDPVFPLDWENPSKNYTAQHRAPIIVRTAPEAVRYLSSGDLNFGGIYLNAVLTPPGVVSLIRMSHKSHAATPIFVLANGEGEQACPFSPQELNRLAVQGVVERKSQDDFFKQLKPPTVDFENTTKETPPACENEPVSDEFLAIPIQRFNFGSKVFFDVFVRAGEKYLKIHPAGGPLPVSQLRNYVRKGVTQLYIQRISHQRCLEYCDLLERTFLTSPGLSTAVKISVTMNKGQSTLDVLRDHRKIVESQLDEIVSFTNDVRRLISQLRLDKSDDVQALMQNVAIYDHSLGTTILALLLAQPLQLVHEQSAEILGIASFLHDIGLSRMPPAVQSEDVNAMIGSQKELYWTHPAVGAQMLRDSESSIHPVAIQVVAQHHERRNGSGFPNKMVGQQIHKLSEVVAFSEEFARLIQARQGVPLKSVIAEMEKRSLEFFSIQMMEAFHKVTKAIR